MNETLDTPRQCGTLAGCYFFFFSLLGIMVPYWGVYLKSLQFDSAQIGQLLAVLMATRIVMPLLWAIRVDKTGRRLQAIRLGALSSSIFFLLFFVVQDYWPIALVLILYASCWSAILPQLEVVTLTTLNKRSHDYSKVRMWGSIGFISSVTVGGFIFEHYGINWLISVGFLLLVCLWLCSLILKYQISSDEITETPKSNGGGFMAIVKQRYVLLFLVAILLLQISHGPYYSFFVLYLIDHGYNESFAGLQIGLGVLAEIGIFSISAWLLRKYAAKSLLLVSMLLSALRWMLTPLVVDDVWLLSLTQCLHAASFGSAHAAAMVFLNQWFVGANRGRGQALYASVSFGIGGALGALLAGFLWQEGAGAHTTWLVAAFFAMLALVLVWLIQCPPINKPTTKQSIT